MPTFIKTISVCSIQEACRLSRVVFTAVAGVSETESSVCKSQLKRISFLWTSSCGLIPAPYLHHSFNLRATWHANAWIPQVDEISGSSQVLEKSSIPFVLKKTKIFWLSFDRLFYQVFSLLEQSRNRQMRTTIKWSMNSMGNGFELIPTSNVRDTCLVFAPPGLNMSSGTYPVRSEIRGHHFQIQEMYSTKFLPEASLSAL